MNDQGATLSILLEQFYDVSSDMVQDALKFMEEDRWDITAKMISTDPGQPPQADPETRTSRGNTVMATVIRDFKGLPG